jgi:hypothetical protein
VVKRHMCIRILHDDGEKETPCHFRVVDATDFDDVVAQRDEARKELAMACARNIVFKNDVFEFKNERDRLRDLFLTYGRHNRNCEAVTESGGHCGCGFDAALSGEGEK